MKSLLSALFFMSSAVLAAPPAFPVPLATFRAEPAEFRGDSATLRVRVVIPEGWHIQSNAPLDDFLIPTEVKALGKGLAFGPPAFPKAIEKEIAALGGKVALFEDTLDVRVPVFRKGAQRDPKGTAKALEKAVVTVRYQACDDSQCLPPREIPARYDRGGL